MFTMVWLKAMHIRPISPLHIKAKGQGHNPSESEDIYERGKVVIGKFIMGDTDKGGRRRMVLCLPCDTHDDDDSKRTLMYFRHSNVTFDVHSLLYAHANNT